MIVFYSNSNSNSNDFIRFYFPSSFIHVLSIYFRFSLINFGTELQNEILSRDGDVRKKTDGLKNDVKVTRTYEIHKQAGFGEE